MSFIYQMQDDICQALEDADGKAKFFEEKWERPGGGGGRTRVIKDGGVFEKGGVNVSTVYGKVTDQMRKAIPDMNGDSWFACGMSMVLHPSNPFVPTTHCNYRMFELYDANGEITDRWFGGGTDLTPYYLFEEDAQLFHQTYKDICDQYDPSFFSKMKADCDEYFSNHHRNNENRGIGGIFYDHCRPSEKQNTAFWMEFAKDCGYALLQSYIPIVNRRKGLPFTPANKYWQEIRRGRYVEFNLVWDRGTIFGLKTNGRTESILMSLPPTVRFEYDYHPESGTEEAKVEEVCLHPREWTK
ncbi:MAG: oxygen-dependent coproporphyrinogen oxidase [Pseudopedobacter saltans]|uniref:coproporphyrinogen oxidase n=1 Tax=Pseudopedobacter saltans TaxID=151895 RepID=A0A2W5GYI0_9SPHI|nr:MAG: oxygen-dependent coproporphyrinogen oxidase [Pseudopedobacter saltans]